MSKESLEKYRLMGLYIVLAVIVGVLVGLLDALFGRVLLYISDVRTSYYLYLVPLLPLAGILIVYMYMKFSQISLKGMTLVFETGLRKRDNIPLALIPLVMIGTWITHLFGGSAGREGVAVQLGATLSHAIGRKMKLPDNARMLLVTGMAAGFAGLFQTPLTAVFFAMEVIVAGVIEYEVIVPALVASYIASATSHVAGLEKFSVNINEYTGNWSDIGFSSILVFKIVLLGVIFGLTGWCFSTFLAMMKSRMSDRVVSPYARIGVMGIVLAVFLIVLHAGRYCGLGTNIIAGCFGDGHIYAYDWVLKILFTVFTLSIGFQGGEVTPLFAIGASLGYIAGGVMGLPPELIAALGYAAVFGSATNTMLAPIFIGLEVFGGGNMVYFAVVCLIAYTVNGNCSIYGAQELRKKL